jgi:hypothetical protein
MSILKGQLQTDTADVLYPHTSSDVVFDPSSGKSVAEQISNLSTPEPATSTKLGVIKVGANLAITSDGVLSGSAPYVHPGSGTNPHGTTKADVGLGSVANYGIASIAEAQTGASNTKYMTPNTGAYQLSARGLWDYCAPITDVHALNVNGNFMGYNAANAPDTGWWMYEVTVHNDQWILVEAIPFTVSSSLNKKQYKYKMNGTWTGWEKPSSGGGDIVGKIYSYEYIQQILTNGVETTIKNYTNTKGGMIRLLLSTNSSAITYRVVIDGVTVINGANASALAQLGYAEQGSYIALDLPFNNNIQIYVLYSTGTTSGHYTKLHYYTNP